MLVARIGPSQVRQVPADNVKIVPAAFSALAPGYSFFLDACGLDYGPPLRDLGFLILAKRLGRLLLVRCNHKTLIEEFMTRGLIVQRANGRGVKLVDDVLRRPLRSEEASP